MSSYNNFVGKLAGDLESGNMQKHMGSLNNEVSPERKAFLQHIINYEYDSYIRLIFDTALNRYKRYFNGKELNNCLIENERDLIPIFTQINEDCLNDPVFSKAIVNGDLYTKKIGESIDSVLFYPPGHYSGTVHDVSMELLYIPSSKPDKSNAFRIDIKEKLDEVRDYPFINFSVDIGDDGIITYNAPVIFDKNENGIIEKPSDMDEAHINFSEEGLNAVRDNLMILFEKTGIKEEVNSSHK